MRRALARAIHVGSIEQLATGYRHSCGLQPDGTVGCWGSCDGESCSPPDGASRVTTTRARWMPQGRPSAGATPCGRTETEPRPGHRDRTSNCTPCPKARAAGKLTTGLCGTPPQHVRGPRESAEFHTAASSGGRGWPRAPQPRGAELPLEQQQRGPALCDGRDNNCDGNADDAGVCGGAAKDSDVPEAAGCASVGYGKQGLAGLLALVTLRRRSTTPRRRTERSITPGV